LERSVFQLPAARVEVQRLLQHAVAALAQRDLALDLRVDALHQEAERVHVLELGLGAELVSPLRRTDTLASARSEPSSMFTSLTPSWRSVTRRRFSQSRASSAEWMSAR
jgi:hypothetical protein